MKRWYKGNLHSHTTNSDGVWTPEQSAKNYRDAGYSFLCFSDHDLYTDYRRELGEKNFLILPGWRLLQYCLMMREIRSDCII